MASVNITSNYVGDVADVLLALMVTGNQAIAKGSVHVELDVKEALFIPRLTSAADQIQARVETPESSDASDSFTYLERSITPLDMMFYDEFNPRYFESVWRPFQPTGPLVDRVDNPQVLNAIISEAVKSVGTQLGKLFWAGDTTGATALSWMDGYEKIIAGDAASIKVTPAGVITAANVIEILEATEAAIPESIWEDPAVVFHMSTADLRLYKEAARALDFKGSNINDALDDRFAGRAIRHYAGLTKDKIIVAKATTGTDSNLWAGIDVNGDDENVKVERLQANSEKFFAKILFKYAVNVALPEEAVIYLPA